MSQDFLPVFAVLRLIRDARSTRNSERELLYALGMRCDPKKKYLSWPSYRMLALDTQLDEVTLKRAAKRLEDRKLIRRVVRKNRSNCFYINVALLQEQAAAVRAAEEAAKRDEVDSPFDEPAHAFTDANTYGIAHDDEVGDDWLSGGAQ